jgi:hypothetical protein
MALLAEQGELALAGRAVIVLLACYCGHGYLSCGGFATSKIAALAVLALAAQPAFARIGAVSTNHVLAPHCL